MRTAILALLSAVMLIGQSAYAAAEKRVALVIGLSAYREVPELANPRNDAEDIAGKLRTLGFEVVEGYDLNREGLTEKIRDFSRVMVGADTALFYYSGHAIQSNGINYLAPVDTRLAHQADIDFELIKLDLITEQMQNAQAEKTLKVGLVFLDACRNNPLTRNLKSTSRAAGTGLARVQDAPHGMLIAFSTQPGNVALDGLGRNSPFTKAVLNNIDKPRVSIGDMLIEVRAEVMQETANKQVPWENSSLTGQFYFNPAEAEAASAPASAAEEPRTSKQILTVDDSAVELRFWESIANSTNPALFAAYLRKFPNGNFVVLAQAKLDELEQKRAIAVEAATTEAPAPEQPAETAQQAASATAAPQETKVASIDPVQTTDALPAGPAEETFSSGSFEAAVLLQKEMKRVGCYGGKLDGDWGTGSRRALQRFNAFAGTALETDIATIGAINALREKDVQVCVAAAPAPAPAKAKAKVARIQVQQPRSLARCPRGHILAEGECVRPRKRVVKRQPREVVVVERRARQRVVVQPQISIGRGGSIGVSIPFGIGIGF